MNNHSTFFAALLFLPGLVSSIAVFAEEPSVVDQSAAAPLTSQYTEKGADTCIKCHDEESDFPVFSIFKTKHAQKTDPRTPFAGQQCESCHGPGAEHAKKVPEGQKQAPIVKFGAKSAVPPEIQNKICLGCHEGGKRIHWSMSAHATNDVACASCHKVHVGKDAVRNKTTQSEVCFTCHKEQRAQIHRNSRHPIPEGKVACTDCHNPHGSAGEKLLVRDNVNDTCYQCHMEKRGPFVRTHQPVQENCVICHNPHGSTQPNLLKVRPPFLCQECHEPTSHRGSMGTPGGTSTSANLMARGCLNCHTNIHGTNNPFDIGNERTFRR